MATMIYDLQVNMEIILGKKSKLTLWQNIYTCIE